MSSFSPQVTRVGKRTNEEIKHDIKLAYGMIKEKRFDEALKSFKTILQDDPAVKIAHLAAGSLLMRKEQYDEAMAHFEEVMRLDPLMPRVHLSIGRIYLMQGNLEKALEACQDALNIDPNSTNAYLSIAQVLVRLEKYDEAIPQLRKALRLDPQLIAARLLLGQVFQKQGNLATALSELKSALNIDPTAWRTYQALGHLYLAQQEYSAAREAFEKGLSLNPELPAPAQLGLVEAIIAQNNLPKATEMLRQVPQVKSIEPKKHKLWGDIYQRQGLLKEATQEYRAAVLLSAEQGETLDDFAAMDALVEQNEDTWQEVVERLRAVANRRVSELQDSQRTGFRERRRGR